MSRLTRLSIYSRGPAEPSAESSPTTATEVDVLRLPLLGDEGTTVSPTAEECARHTILVAKTLAAVNPTASARVATSSITNSFSSTPVFALSVKLDRRYAMPLAWL